jgi:DNA invertase Pin-like site-specific DNA recombinase
MMGMLDQWERMTITRKLARGRATKASKGDKPAGVAPFGYKYSADRKHIEVDPTEAPTVKMMFTEGQKGKSLNQIAQLLNGQGITTRRGKTWSAGNVQVILHNRFYLGELTHQGQTIKGNHERLISSVQFGKVAAQLDKRRRA